jgi:predicted SprT family Zn-dependent metalloprotease
MAGTELWLTKSRMARQLSVFLRPQNRWPFKAMCSIVTDSDEVGQHTVVGVLSIALWSRASEQDRRETVIHETCHVIVGYKHGFLASHHGAEWKQAMKNCGVEPVRTHNVDRTGLARQQRRFILLDCPAEGVESKCRCTARDYNRLRRGKELWRKKCGLHLTQGSPIEEDQAATEPFSLGRRCEHPS